MKSTAPNQAGLHPTASLSGGVSKNFWRIALSRRPRTFWTCQCFCWGLSRFQASHVPSVGLFGRSVAKAVKGGQHQSHLKRLSGFLEETRITMRQDSSACWTFRVNGKPTPMEALLPRTSCHKHERVKARSCENNSRDSLSSAGWGPAAAF